MSGPVQRVLLVQPPIEDFYTTAVRQEPLGLESLAGALLSRFPDLQCRFLDGRAGGQRPRPLPPALAELHTYYLPDDKSPFRLFGEYRRFGLEEARLAAAVADFRPDLVAISALFRAYAPQALEMARLCKRAWPTTRVVLGGGFPTLSAEEALADVGVDFIIRGEGETPLSDLVAWLRAGAEGEPPGIPGLGYRRGDGRLHLSPPQHEEDFENLPAPWRPPGNWPYRLGREKLAALVFSRGCPQQCLFCSSRELFGPRHRRRRVAEVVAEMAALHDRRGITAFNFEDDNLTADPPAAGALFAAILDRFGPRALSLYAMNGLSYFHLSPELLELFWQAGLRKLDVSLATTFHSGTETGYLQRGVDSRAYQAVLQKAADLKLPLTTYFIAGLPGQKPLELSDTILTLYRLPTLLAPSFFYLIPGTRLARHLQREHQWEWPPDPSFLARSAALNSLNPDLPRENMAALFTVCRVLNFIKGRKPLSREEGELLQTAAGDSEVLKWPAIPSANLLGRLVLRRYLETGEFCSLPGGKTGGKWQARFVPRPLPRELGQDLLQAVAADLRRAAQGN